MLTVLSAVAVDTADVGPPDFVVPSPFLGVPSEHRLLPSAALLFLILFITLFRHTPRPPLSFGTPFHSSSSEKDNFLAVAE